MLAEVLAGPVEGRNALSQLSADAYYLGRSLSELDLSSWLPSEIAGLDLWFDPATDVYADHAGTIPAVDGDDAKHVKGRAGNYIFKHYVETAGRHPKLRTTGLAGGAGLELDGIDDALRINPDAFCSKDNPYTSACVMWRPDGSANFCLGSDSHPTLTTYTNPYLHQDGNAYIIAVNGANSVVYNSNYAWSPLTPVLTVVTYDPTIAPASGPFSVRSNGAAVPFFYQGAYITAYNPYMDTLGFRGPGPLNWFKGFMGEWVLWPYKKLSLSEILQVESYLASKYPSIALP